MDYNVYKILNKIIAEEDLLKEFSQLDDMGEMYNYCKDLGSGYTEEEFDESVAEAINSLQSHEWRMEISDEDLEYTAGGVNFNGLISKTVAVMLSALTLSGTAISSGVKAAEVSQNSGGTQVTINAVKDENASKWSKTKAALSNFWKNHKKKIIIGGTIAVVAAAGTAALAYRHKRNEEAKGDQKIEEQRKEEEFMNLEEEIKRKEEEQRAKLEEERVKLEENIKSS